MENHLLFKIKSHAQNSRDFIIDLLFPLECAACGREGVLVCPACLRRIPYKKSQSCLGCKKEDPFGRFCLPCRLNHHLNGVWIAGDYENQLLATLIKNLKYRLLRGLADDLGEFISVFLRSLINRARLAKNASSEEPENFTIPPRALLSLEQVILMPVPLHQKRYRWRGFNQAEAISRAISRRLSLNHRPDSLARVRHTPPQAKLNEKDRLENVRECFRWSGPDLGGAHIILVDDVVTTGATLEECARELKAHGAGEVWGLVAAKG